MLFRSTIDITKNTDVIAIDCDTVSIPDAKTIYRISSESDQIHDLLNNSTDYTVIVLINKNRWIDFYLELFDLYTVQRWVIILNKRLSLKFKEILNDTDSYDNDNDEYKYKIVQDLVHIYHS